MISYKRFQLNNGLRVIVHQDKSTPLVAINMLYNVGSKHEHPERTGFAHLFEHLMFSGSENIPNFDDVIQNCGGENNAFTNSDITNFFELVPRENFEVVLWLESDRMKGLNINNKSLSVQKKVVIEEFKETCLNTPYGESWHLISNLAYKQHPYRWPTIGLTPDHIEQASIDDVKFFYSKFYTPNNAIMVIAGNIAPDEAFEYAKKWFEDIPMGNHIVQELPKELSQQGLRQEIVYRNVPQRALYLAFHMPGRKDKMYYTCDILSDVLANGRSSRLYQRLYKKQKLFNSIDAYISGYEDNGLFIIESRLNPETDMEHAKQAIWHELKLLMRELIDEKELQKLKNKLESSLQFSEVNVLHKAMSLAYFEHLGDADMINHQASCYEGISAEEIRKCAQEIFSIENCSELQYLPLGEQIPILN